MSPVLTRTFGAQRSTTAMKRLNPLLRYGILVWTVVILLVSACRSQTVHIKNYSDGVFHGWKRVAVDQPILAVGQVDDVLFVRGRQCGKSLWICDLRVKLQPQQELTIDLSTAKAAKWEIGDPLHGQSFLRWFGGVPLAGTTPLDLESVAVDGAAFVAVFGARSGMFYYKLWTLVYPDQPAWINGELLIACSNPSIPDIVAELPEGPGPSFGDAVTFQPGTGWNSGWTSDVFATGQARVLPVSFIWLRHVTPDQVSTGLASVQMRIGGYGVSRVLPYGNPSYPPNFNVNVWTSQFEESARRLHTWEAGVAGVAPYSASTGAQEDQVFVRGECFLPGGVGAELIAYTTALKMANRPCHHLEVSGAQIRLEDHPNLVTWGSVPHWHSGVSPDRLGKLTYPTIAQSHGWSGADREHWLVNSLSAACRLTGSYGCQWLLEMQARIFLFSETVKPGWSTSHSDAARSIGWAGLLVAHLNQNLENQQLLGQVIDRWRQRVTQVYVPELMSSDIWDPRLDPRLELNPNEIGWMSWQQSIGSMGLDVACEQVGPEIGRTLALKAAKFVLDNAFREVDGRWTHIGNIPVNATEARLMELARLPRPWTFFTNWAVPAVQVVLRHEPTNVRARSIYAAMLSESEGSSRSWFLPGVQ